ncbi:hypothetical protein JCM11641_006122 [Rhodosporidiobolus odoratus]
MPPSIDVFVTSILSNPALRGRHERVRRALTAARVPYAEHDVAGDEEAKRLWKRKNGGKNELPFVLSDGEPVGNIEDLDEAVEFGELRQFLRLDAPAQPASSSAPAAPVLSSAEPSQPTPSSPSRSKPSLDDFTSLDLTPSELAELERELAAGETFSSGLGSSASNHKPYDFSTTQRFEPVFAPTAPLKFEKVNFTRPLPDRPLASEVVKDELEGIDTEEIAEDELDKLARELEAEEEERRRLRDAQGEAGRGVEPPPLPEKVENGETTQPEVPRKDAGKPEGSVGQATSVEGAGGAELSAPIEEVEKLKLSEDTVASIASDIPSSGKVDVEPSATATTSVCSPQPSNDATSSPPRPQSRTSPRDAATLKAELHKAVSASDDADPEKLRAVGGSMSVTEMPSFGVKDMQEGLVVEAKADKPAEPGAAPEEETKDGEEEDGLADRVAQAIRDGDL